MRTFTTLNRINRIVTNQKIRNAGAELFQLSSRTVRSTRHSARTARSRSSARHARKKKTVYKAEIKEQTKPENRLAKRDVFKQKLRPLIGDSSQTTSRLLQLGTKNLIRLIIGMCIKALVDKIIAYLESGLGFTYQKLTDFYQTMYDGAWNWVNSKIQTIGKYLCSYLPKDLQDFIKNTNPDEERHRIALQTYDYIKCMHTASELLSEDFVNEYLLCGNEDDVYMLQYQYLSAKEQLQDYICNQVNQANQQEEELFNARGFIHNSTGIRFRELFTLVGKLGLKYARPLACRAALKGFKQVASGYMGKLSFLRDWKNIIAQKGADMVTTAVTTTQNQLDALLCDEVKDIFSEIRDISAESIDWVINEVSSLTQDVMEVIALENGIDVKEQNIDIYEEIKKGLSKGKDLIKSCGDQVTESLTWTQNIFNKIRKAFKIGRSLNIAGYVAKHLHEEIAAPYSLKNKYQELLNECVEKNAYHQEALDINLEQNGIPYETKHQILALCQQPHDLIVDLVSDKISYYESKRGWLDKLTNNTITARSMINDAVSAGTIYLVGCLSFPAAFALSFAARRLFPYLPSKEDIKKFVSDHKFIIGAATVLAAAGAAYLFSKKS